MNAKQKEKMLNDYYMEMPESRAIDEFEYLTNPSRGEHTTINNIRKQYRNGKLGTLLKKYDPIAFYTE